MLIGLTGGIGSGKSAASACFQSLGIPVVDADVVAREVVEPGTRALQEITEHFGTDILIDSGRLDRASLRARVFAEPAQRLWLEELLHPLIRTEIVGQLAAAMKQAASPYAILSSPLLLESGQDALVNRVLLIDARTGVQRERALLRDGSDASTIDAIIASQWSREQRLERAHDIILNEGDLEQLKAAVIALDSRYRILSAALTAQEGQE